MGTKKYTVNENFFRKPNSLNSYWAGFLAADGYITFPGKNSSRIGIKLSPVDEEHLERFIDDLEFSGKVYKRKDGYSSVEINGVIPIIKDLKNNFNIVPRKSLVLNPPNLTSTDLIWAYIIGYIDGDGWISQKEYSYSKNCLEIGVAGTFNVLSWIKYYFDNLYPAKTKRIPNVKKHGKIFKYRVSGERANFILTTLNQFNVPKLKRKWTKLKHIKEL